MKVFIATDHTGFILKNTLVEYLRDVLLYEVEDLGAHELAPEDDYPDLIQPCAKAVAENKEALGIILGGSGQGEAMAANRMHGARAAVFYGQGRATAAIDAEGAPALDGFDIVRLAREHNDANMLSLAARFVTEDDAKEAVRIFLETPFTGAERHMRRIQKLDH
ncbi:MAG TPA: RpiB/LacA/LacB family sugar-phosphate isomerase [Candidatus Paceibacterota bacterium]|nr:RpiB/LacA/LacB family sugar-phosphate isomerase [Candidatus Paceibacterota bacterium]